ncbi:MAG: UDP-N-acetylmuramate--L-alanine ligase [bacterium]|nr:UDP-N-acetylmuramate--L-alanine ligase [bacterium]
MTIMRERVYFIGIGGIGVSALARLYRNRGFLVSGSDIARSEITDTIKREGVHIFIGPHRASHIAHGVTRVIYTAAAKPSNPELREARRRGIRTLSLAEAVGELTREFRTIAVTGSHGKSTTTALIALVLIRGGLDPTVQIGTKLKEFKNTNARIGRSPYLVLEADEYRNKFLKYTPAIAVVTNIDREHLDFHPTMRAIEAAFSKFLLRVQPSGTAVLNADDHRLRRIAPRLRRARPDLGVTWYSLKNPAVRKIRKVIRIPGEHNVSNAAAAYAVGKLLRIPEKKIIAAIAAFRGAWRRFDYQGRFSGADVIADYAHHPTEIRATLQAAREKYPQRRIWCVFQPHHYERTRALFPEFSAAFKDCDAAVLLDIYEVAGREHKQQNRNVSSEHLAQAITRHGTPALYFRNRNQLGPFLKRWLKPQDVLLMMGAGDIWETTKELMKSTGKWER